MAYRNRYWIDAGGGWRDRRNKNRPSSGPKRKVDRRKYRVRPPDTWVTEETIKRRRKKREKAEREKAVSIPAGQLLRHSSPRDYKSTFKRVLESVDDGHPNQIITAYIILRRTNAAYITQKNPKGVRVFAQQWGDITRAEARKMTIGDVTNNDKFKFDPDWHPAIRALKGTALTRTPNKGDEQRKEIAKHFRSKRR